MPLPPRWFDSTLLRLSLPSFIFFFFFFLPLLGRSAQFYDGTPCASPGLPPGSRYQCTNPALTAAACNTYVVYRSRGGFNTVSAISDLFGTGPDPVLLLNNLTDPSHPLDPGRDVLLPARCSCSPDGFFRSQVRYATRPARAAAFSRIACEAFGGLVKAPALADANREPHPGLGLDVPVRCACPDARDAGRGFRFLVTYPLEEFDEIELLARKFDVPEADIWSQNTLAPAQTIYPNTAILIPQRSVPAIRYGKVSGPSGGRGDSFIPTDTGTGGVIRTEGAGKYKYKYKYAVGTVAAGLMMFLLVVALFVLGYRWGWGSKKRKRTPVAPAAGTSYLPDLFNAGMSKYSLKIYATEELGAATGGFREDARLGSSVHKGTVGGGDGCREVAIERTTYRDARRIVGIHSKINHSNFVKLDGVCYGRGESYLVFEFARKGSLRDRLSDPKEEIPWSTRTQIAFDVAVGLHYIHHCTIPSLTHMNVTSTNILITEGWRAKIANLGAGARVAKDSLGPAWVAPEYLLQGSVSTKVDVFAFGVVLFELLSAKDAARDGSFLRDSLSFSSGGGVTGFDQVRRIVDPRLREYPMGEALCLSVLAKACLEEDPMLRPSMNDILKILATMVSLYSIECT